MGTRWLLRALLAIGVAAAVCAVPSAVASSEGAVPGGNYEYMKLGPKLPTSKYPNIVDTVGVEVSQDGKHVEVGWSVLTNSGCVTAGGGRVQPFYNGINDVKIPLEADGSFHGIVRSKGKYVRTYVSEIYGQFTATGSFASVRLRQKTYVVKAEGMWSRCDGRWLRYRLCYTEGHSIPPKCVKPPATGTEPSASRRSSTR